MNTNRILLPSILIISVMAIVLISGFYIYSQQGGTKIKIGSLVPEFTLPDQNGNDFDLRNVIGKKNLVIYFYPKDETIGCTKEACSFRDKYEAFVKADAMVIGISSQSIDSHKEFSEKYNLPFTLLSDSENTVHKLFGVSTNEKGSIAGRVTFVVDKNGVVIYTFNSLTQPLKHVEEALRILKAK